MEDVRREQQGSGWRVARHHVVRFEPAPDTHAFSDYHAGDVHTRLFEADDRDEVHCKVGMATAAAKFEIAGGGEREVVVRVQLEKKRGGGVPSQRFPGWDGALSGATVLRVPERHIQSLFDAAVHTLVLHSPGEVYPGPYTYKRFWFRDAAFILHALLCVGLAERVERVLDTFPRRQTATGLYHSQQGEWDSNGEALWILLRYGVARPEPEAGMVDLDAARQSLDPKRNRLTDDGEALHAGLLPPGFSAEHLGPNDYYFWDDFWGTAGLRAASLLLRRREEGDPSAFREEEARFRRAVDRCLSRVALRLGRPAMPASP